MVLPVATSFGMAAWRRSVYSARSLPTRARYASLASSKDLIRSLLLSLSSRLPVSPISSSCHLFFFFYPVSLAFSSSFLVFFSTCLLFKFFFPLPPFFLSPLLALFSLPSFHSWLLLSCFLFLALNHSNFLFFDRPFLDCNLLLKSHSNFSSSSLLSAQNHHVRLDTAQWHDTCICGDLRFSRCACGPIVVSEKKKGKPILKRE